MQRLLIAGSDHVWLGKLAAHLLQTGYRVETADGGVECVRRLRSSQPYALIVDAELLWGGVDGVLDLLQEDFADGAAPLMIIVGSPPAQPGNRRSLPDWVECLPKPIDPSEVAAAILNTTSKRLSLSHF